MKIALVVPGGVDRSGEQRVIPMLLALIERLAAAHSVHVFALRQEPRPASWELRGARIHNIGKPWTRVRTLRAIHTEHRTAPFQLVQAIWSGAGGAIAVAAGWALRIPSLVHVAGGEAVSLPQIGFGGRRTWYGRAQEAIALRGASVVTTNSAPLVAVLQTLGREARRLPLGVDLNAWPLRQPVRRATGQPARLIHVATLNRVKDQPTLLRAVALLARRGVDFQLDIVGEDILHGALQALTQELGLTSRTRFHGRLTQRELLPLVQSAHVMLISSLHEAGPVAMLEAATAGVPTVGTAVGHVAEWAPTAALAVPVGDWVSLADALERILSDEELRLRLGAEAARRCREEDADCTARRFEALYQEVLARR
jgi:glycosyltransferase involved in cell wall biosynthesis